MSTESKKARTLPPSRLAHVVLRTNNLKEMSSFYKTFLGGEAQVENDQVSFITYDDEHHRIALVQRPDLKQPPAKSCGLDVRMAK
jgi:catechol-2,3-dioxygenase